MGITDSFSSLKDVLIGIDNVHAIGTLMELQQQAYSILDENRELRLKFEEIERANEISGNLSFKNGAYYLQDDENPYCSNCWDLDKKLVHLTKAPGGTRLGNKKCPACANFFTVTYR